jgi:hypothetical protein
MPDLEHLKTLFPIMRTSQIGCPSGWYSVLLDLALDLSLYAQRQGLNPEINHVTTKMGELRAWVRCPDATNEQWGAIQDIEARHYAMSKIVCQQCGRKGRRVTIDHVVFTLCKACNP